MKAVTADAKRRIIMPRGCQPGSLFTIQELGDNAWLVKKAMPDKRVKMVAIPVIKTLPDDPAWEKVESAFARRACATVSEPGE